MTSLTVAFAPKNLIDPKLATESFSCSAGGYSTTHSAETWSPLYARVVEKVEGVEGEELFIAIMVRLQLTAETFAIFARIVVPGPTCPSKALMRTGPNWSSGVIE